MVFDFFRRKPADPEMAGRVPPGQYVTEKWPVLHYGGVPTVPRGKWEFRVFGLIEGEPRTLTFQDLLALPQTQITDDIHCVTRWSRLGAQFEGVLITDLMQGVHLKPEATHGIVHAEHNYTTNLALDDLLRPNVMLAHRADGGDLAPEHGGPVRLVVPHLYFWKSAKWVRGIEITNRDRPGFWESYGYHMRGDPWAEERYSG
jgi:DMSO/TMAO reductase YedYZ molybdopterin-dependent catalytic subunit